MTDETEILTATEASRAFSELLHRVCYGSESFIIKKGSRLMARIVPVESVEREIVTSAPTPAAIEMAVEMEAEPPPPGTTPDEAEFYRAWMEQVRKVEA